MQVLVLGSGQLARMMALAGAPLNITLSAFDVSTQQVVHPLTQTPIDQSLTQAIEQADVITAEFEHIPHDILQLCEQSNKLFPTSDAIKAGGDRRLEKALLDQAKVNNAPYYFIEKESDFELALNHVGLPMVLKTALGGYDGKGQWRIHSADDIEQVKQEVTTLLASEPTQAIVAEAWIAFSREVSLVGARTATGEIDVYPLAENIHVQGVLSLSSALFDKALQQQATTMFCAVAEQLNYVGVLALEFFDVNGQLLVNEIAPRVHNSGHWTQQGAETCQFENHLRAVCGLPLGSMKALRHTTMINILGIDVLPNELLSVAGCHLHWYGKTPRIGRKMGHINLTADNAAELHKQLNKVKPYLDVQHFPALHLSY